MIGHWRMHLQTWTIRRPLQLCSFYMVEELQRCHTMTSQRKPWGLPQLQIMRPWTVWLGDTNNSLSSSTYDGRPDIWRHCTSTTGRLVPTRSRSILEKSCRFTKKVLDVVGNLLWSSKFLPVGTGIFAPPKCELVTDCVLWDQSQNFTHRKW